ncbi:uncharacterized protein SPPG_04588 [Spizellomyces punctatus DAOM BR117]|uniref:Beta-lactamase-related domain-containing protein n=1 Tax=Spizellomyces punctatus (strain DAOM BR117) TaxID=645134 RepID=A0A0L0HGP3_SPIPD|nr:uncharacterized protein SPPG_04588 [Spizellomyces punctatus DAOM BR117]KND00258.1 hypothetical protein SPPG_04588 [Spizellomyces punctatus DAOM BR117]|eukprot:XP_016608297.1 hypothetical protein SPPG_04588 [Spizellomyces punctatus DAOM BR117]
MKFNLNLLRLLSRMLPFGMIADKIDKPTAIAPPVGKCPLPLPIVPLGPYNLSSAPWTAILQQLNLHLQKAEMPTSHSVIALHGNQILFTSGDLNAHFRLGSITKIFTGMGALILREQGTLSLDDAVIKYLPEFSIQNPYAENYYNNDITLRQLMAHTSGLPREACPLIFCGNDEAEVLKGISEMKLVVPPWSSVPAYSNLGYALLGHAWEKLTGTSWSEWLGKEVLIPLGMERSGMDIEAVKDLAPTSPDGELIKGLSLQWVAPAGDMYSTAIDLSKFLSLILNGTPSGLPILQEATIAEWTRPVTLLPDSRTGFALGWELIGIPNTPYMLITKSGLWGHKSHIAFHPPTNIGVILLAGDTAIDLISLGSNFFSTLIPIVENIHTTAVRNLYAGTYVCPSVGSITVDAIPGSGLFFAQDRGTVTAYANLLPKNTTENSFWVSFVTAADCLAVAWQISSFPHSDGEPDGLEVFFEFQKAGSPTLFHWPSNNLTCIKDKS